jgi:uncharacterized repeat protein (TIGR01451 family)
MNISPAALVLPLTLAASTLLSWEALGQVPPPCVVNPPPVVATGGSASLFAGACVLTMPDTTAVTMWGYGATATTIGVPGPALVVPPGATSLSVTLTNNLPEATSLVIPGQTKSMAPVFFTDGAGRQRVRAFDVETSAGGTLAYTWPAVKAGTFLYQSGSHPGVQVQMGLYGPVTVQPAAGNAYTGVAYDKEVDLVLSEVDATLHSAVANGRYGTPAPNPLPAGLTAADYPQSPVDYHPRYYLVNGSPFQDNAADGSPLFPITADTGGALLNAGDRILIRFLNAGYRTHSMAIFAPTPAAAAAAVPAPYFTLLAEDGNPYAYARQLWNAYLPAGKTLDALFTPAAPGDYSVQDRMLSLTNGSAVADAGLQAVLRIGGTAVPIASADSYATAGNSTLTVAAPGVLGNDSGTGLSATLVATTTHGSLTLNADGSFTYTPTPGFAGTDSFTYYATSGATNSNTVTVTIAVTLPPVAVNDGPYSTNAGATFTVPASGVLANDTSPSGAPLTATLATAPVAGTLALASNGGFTYVAPSTTVTNPVTFTYRAWDGSQFSAPATVSINVIHPAPIAVNETATTTMNVSLAINVLANDTASGATLVPSSVAIQTPPSNGGTALVNTTTGAVNYTPPSNWSGTEVFTYTVKDSLGSASNIATVTVNITGTQLISKSFQPTWVNPGQTSQLRITMSNTSPTAVTGAAFVDTLPAGLTISGNPASPQCGGTVTRNAARTQLSFSGGTVPAANANLAGTCTVVATVTPSATLGPRVNTIPVGGFTSSSGSNTVAATATLTVVGRPAVGKAFSPTSIARTTGTSTLTVTLTNTNTTLAITGVTFTDTLPRTNNNNKVLVAAPANLTTTCGGTVTSSNGTTTASTVRLQGGTIPAGGSCTVTATVSGTNSLAAGSSRTYTNTIPSGGVLTTNAGSNNVSASATLTVQ